MGHTMIRRIGVASLAIVWTVTGVRGFHNRDTPSRASDVSRTPSLNLRVQNSSRIKTLSATFVARLAGLLLVRWN